MKRTYLACVGNANDPSTWSGIPFYFLDAARRSGILDEGLDLYANSLPWRLQRLLWNSVTAMHGRRLGGFQYSDYFLQRIYAPFQNKLTGSRLINFFQLYPTSIVRNTKIEKWFYIDMTLRQLFRCYGAAIDDRTADEAFLREEEGYMNAAGVLAHSHWAAKSVVEEYGVSADAVHVAVPGASFDMDAYREWDRSSSATPGNASLEPLRLVFVGKYSQRKGLDRLLAAVHIARARGASIVLRVIGLEKKDSPVEWRSEPGIEWFGFVKKRTEARRFLHAVADNDVGCLLSRAEAGGIVLREFHALGLPVIGPAVGGAPEHMFREASIQVAPEASDDAIADILVHLCNDRSALARMREHAWNHRHEALWDATVAKIVEFAPPGVPARSNFPELNGQAKDLHKEQWSSS